MKETVTIQDIANALGISRNTVSKALNGKPVPAKTRNAVISMAIEMGYKGYKLVASSDKKTGQKKILLISSRLLLNINYYIHVLRGLEESLADYEVELIQFNISTPASFAKLKRFLSENEIDGVLCIEFFEPEYIEELLSLEHPLIFIDFPVVHRTFKGKYTIILPESQEAVKNLCLQMIKEKNCKTFGFVGDYMHCRSFYERFTGMKEALFFSGIDIDLSYSILNEDTMPYKTEQILQAVKALPVLPDCFVAANDSIAMYLMEALKSLKIKIPEDVRIIGFDNISDSKHAEPPLSTFNVNKTDLGKMAASVILERVSDKTQTNQVIHVFSKAVLRGTT